jgi:cell division protein FtsB
MGKVSYTKIGLTLLLILSLLPLQGAFGEGDRSEQEALQFFLSIHEIEKEIERVEAEEKKLQADLELYKDRILMQQQQMAAFKEQAGKVVRAYYMGDRIDLLLLLLDSGNFSDLMMRADYLSYIFEQDQERLTAYHDEVEQLKKLLKEKEERIQELNNLHTHLIAQKNLMSRIEGELANVMKGLPDKEKIRLLQQQLIRDWETRGIPTFDLFLTTISSSMSGVAKEFKDHVSFSLTGATLEVTDQDFTRYLRKQSDLFKNFQIQFDADGLTFFGEYEGIALTMKGVYVLESENTVSFEIRELLYNGFILPSSTTKNLQDKYDLGIYTEQIHEGIKIKDITLDKGTLNIRFSLKF